MGLTLTELVDTAGGGTHTGTAVLPPTSVTSGTFENNGIRLIAWLLEAAFKTQQTHNAVDPPPVPLLSVITRKITFGSDETNVRYSVNLNLDTVDLGLLTLIPTYVDDEF